MTLRTMLILVAVATAGLWYEKGFAVAVSYLFLLIGTVVGIGCLRIAWELYREYRETH